MNAETGINKIAHADKMNKSRSFVNIERIEPKGSDSSVVASSQTEREYKPPPKVEVDRYQDAFKGINMGPHSKSFVTFTPSIEEQVHSKDKVSEIVYTTLTSCYFTHVFMCLIHGYSAQIVGILPQLDQGINSENPTTIVLIIGQGVIKRLLNNTQQIQGGK